jgi:hypothetical protein
MSSTSATCKERQTIEKGQVGGAVIEVDVSSAIAVQTAAGAG